MEKGTGSYRHEKEPSRFIEMKTVQWYPGHMAKAMRMLEENLNLVDAVLLVLDARAPLSSYNPRLEKLVKNKPVLFVFNKRDLADPKSDEIGEAFKERGKNVVYLSAVKGQARPLLNAMAAITKEKAELLKNKNSSRPLRFMVAGVPNTGKSSLINEILCKSLMRTLNRARCIAGKHTGIDGVEKLDKVINIDQSPIGRTPRSNPATYTGVFDMIRDLFASTPDAKAKGYLKGRFSFNVKGGRCEACSGDGILKIEMNFLPDIYVPCEVCHGKRYNRETLEVKYKGKSIYDVLDMTVEDALDFFKHIPSIHRKIQTLYDVGLSYVKLGQPSTTLSGGEAQRIKLATELSKRSTGRTIYILDEPTTGLHFADVHKLIEILQRLTEGGNSVVVIEHNLDVIKTADYIIDMGPEGGDRGGTVVVQGTPEQVAKCESSYTGYYMKKILGE